MLAHPPLRLGLYPLILSLIVCMGYAGQTQPSISIGDKPLQIEGRVPTAGTLSRTPEAIPEDVLDIEMLKPQLGILGTLEPKDLVSINRLARPIETDPEFPGTDPIAYLHCSRGQTTLTLSLHELGDETLLLSTLQTPPRQWSLQSDAFEQFGIVFESGRTNDRFSATTEAMSLELPSPHVESPIVLEPQTVRSRIRISFPRLERELGKETFRVRLPKNYDPANAAGVLVWISPSHDGRIPTIFEPICDELGLIALGIDNNGNDRPITDRLQNHLDSIETLAQHALIDRRRVYLTGMSGGGRCSGILQLCFPDLFAGAVPIVGLDTYHNAPTGTPGQYWPKRCGKPNGPNMKLLRERRIRSITGSADFNEPEMTLRTKLLQADGITAQIDVIEGMAHTLPSAEQFNAAIRWVDEPRREAIKTDHKTAQDLLEETQGRDPSLPAVRRQLIEVMELLPYSSEAWQAAARLGYERGD